MHATRAGAALLLTTTLVLPLTTTQPTAHAAKAAPAAIDMWADFQTPAPWMDQKDNLHFYVQSPVITKQMANRTATTTITAPAALDCSEIGSGFVKDDAWSNVDLTITSCTGTEAVVSYKVTKNMIGSRVFVNGWSATTTSPATVNGTVTIGKTTLTSTVTAERHDAPEPVAPGTVLGTHNGQQVTLASEAGANQIWVGGKLTDAPSGEIIHSALTDGAVALWYKNEASVDQWKLNLTTGEVTTKSVPMLADGKGFAGQNTAGFLVLDRRGLNFMGNTLNYFYVDWDGVQRDTFNSLWGPVGFTDTAVLVMGSYKAFSLSITDIDGTDWPAAPVRVTPGKSDLTILPDRVEYTVENSDGLMYRCTLTKQAATCDPLPVVKAAVAGTVLGQVGGKELVLAGEGTSHQLWWGEAKLTDLPNGTLVRTQWTPAEASLGLLSKPKLTLWLQDGNTLTTWKRDFSQAEATSTTVSGDKIVVGRSGYTVLKDGRWTEYTWAGPSKAVEPTGITAVGSSDNAWVYQFDGSQTYFFNGQNFFFGSGSEMYGDQVPRPEGVTFAQHVVSDLQIKPEAITYTRAFPYTVTATGVTGEVVQTCTMAAPPLTCTTVSNPLA